MPKRFQYGTGQPPKPDDPNDPVEMVILKPSTRPHKKYMPCAKSLANLRPQKKGMPAPTRGQQMLRKAKREELRFQHSIMAAVRRQLDESPQVLDVGAKKWLWQYAKGDYRAREQLLDRLDGPVPRPDPRELPRPMEFTLNIGIVNKPFDKAQDKPIDVTQDKHDDRKPDTG